MIDREINGASHTHFELRRAKMGKTSGKKSKATKAPGSGKKSNKGGQTGAAPDPRTVARKMALQQKLAEEQAMAVVLNRANFVEDPETQLLVPRDPLVDLAPFVNFNRNGLSATLEFHAGELMPEELFDWVFGLTETNMAAMYADSSWGWKPAQKRAELRAPEARYVVVRATDEACTPLAYVHFRFEEEDGAEVLYVYDMQLEAAAQRKALGKHLLCVMELAARKVEMAWVMLTVFKSNAASMAFFAKNGYEIDDTSPSVAFAPTQVESQVDYEILSKQMPEPAHAVAARRAAVEAAKAEEIAELEALGAKAAPLAPAKQIGVKSLQRAMESM